VNRLTANKEKMECNATLIAGKPFSSIFGYFEVGEYCVNVNLASHYII
jgi:hypothetical protein